MQANTLGSYRFYSSSNLSNQHLELLRSIFSSPPKPVGGTLEGRISVSTVMLDGIGSVVVKHYRRGGFISCFLKRKYLKSGKTRCQIEYEQLRNADQLGINVPEPLAYAYKGWIFYQGWLITREIKLQESLAKLSCVDAKRTHSAIKKLTDQVILLINNHIYHTDLHPGNVLVDDNNRVFIIDFDKAGYYEGNKNKLQRKYLQRWNRAVIKHRLPGILYLDTL